jgi:hypothetical protein
VQESTGDLLELTQIQTRGEQIDSPRAADDCLAGLGIVQENLGHTGLVLLGCLTQSKRSVSLGIEVHEQHTLSASREGTGQVDGGSGLATSTFLVD